MLNSLAKNSKGYIYTMSDAALSRVAHLIKLEDDLVKIQSLRQQFTKEKTLVDIKLNAATQTQIDSIMNNLKKLNNSANKLNTIKSSLNRLNQIHDESVTGVAEYTAIKQMTNVNQFLTQVQHLYHDISKYKQYLDSINKLIDEEFAIISEDISYPLLNIFRIHYSLTQARNFQDYLETISDSLSDDLKSIVFKVVLPVKKTIKKFDDLLGEIIISLTEALKEGNVELVFKLIKIIEFESNEDLKFALMSNLKLMENKSISSIDYANFRSAKRNYKKIFYKKLEESLVDTFDKCVEHFSYDRILVYDNLNWLEDELVFVADTLSPMFPTSWNINTFIQNAYYNRLHNFTMDLIKTDPPAEDLLKILAYDSHYGKFVVALHTSPEIEGDEKRKSTQKKEQKSIMGEELKKVVLDDYLKVIVAKMNEWTDTLLKLEATSFVQRETPPDIYTYYQTIEDEDIQDQPITLEIHGEVFVLPDFKTPLTMLKEQADVAVDSGYGSILVGVIENWSSCYIKRVLNYKEIIEEEFDKYMSVYNNERFLIQESKTKRLFRRHAPQPTFDIENMTPEELANISKPGLIEYLCALGNTYEINTDRLQDKFLPNYKSKVHSNYQSRIQVAFEDTVSPSTELNAQVIRAIIDIILNDLYPALSSVFTKTWYGDKSQTSDEPNMAERILETISEYMQELRSYASYDIYLCTFALFLDSFISAYIRIGYENILHGSGKKIDPTATKKFKSFSEGVGRDVTIFYGGLEHLFTRKDSAYLLNSLRAIEFLGDLATCEDPMNFIPQMWENEILGSFYFCSVEYVRGICLCRKDMDKNQVNTLVRQLEDIAKEYHENVPVPSQLTGTLNEFFYN